MKRSRPKQSKGILTLVVAILLTSGSIRLGSVGFALAKEAPEDSAQTVQDNSAYSNETKEDIKALMEILNARESLIFSREKEQNSRQEALDESEEIIRQNLKELEDAEKRLSSTIQTVSGASEQDVHQLTAVYEAMKAKDAALLFEQMTPEFAAGFLGEMTAASAAGIMSGLTAEKAYEVSVVLAGRNAKAPRK